MKKTKLLFILFTGFMMNAVAQNNSSEDCFNKAMSLKSEGKYDESTKWMDQFCKLKPADLRAKDYITNGKDLSILLKDHGNYMIDPMHINSKASDFGASFYNNKLVFASTRTNFRRRKLNLYVSYRDNDQFKTPELFDKSWNGKLHDGPATFSNKGLIIAYTTNYSKNKEKPDKLQIFFSSNIDGKWSKPESFYLNNKNYSVGHPCLTEDGNTMYFMSDMPGGFGKTDLYKITRKDKGGWGKPENMGAKVNTEGDEMYPFFEENNNILFFSSNGRFGLGGLDIFVYAINDSGYGRAYNVGFPLNSQYDDFAVVVDRKMSLGYFTSNRKGGKGDNDIYSVKFGNPRELFSITPPENRTVIPAIIP